MNNATEKTDAATSTLDQEAWVWLRLLHSGNARKIDLDGFQHWVHASRAHQAAFSAARREWQHINAAAALHQQHATLPRAAAAGPGRRRWLKTALAGTGVAVVGAALWPTAGSWVSVATDSTATGEQRSMALGGVNLTLNTQTSVRQLRDGERVHGIDLIKGEAAIDIADARALFSVNAGVGSSSTQAGSFEVRLADNKVCVSCVGGTVLVRHPAGQRSLSAGQQTIYDEQHISGIGAADVQAVSAWRHGELKFDRTPLRTVIAEINRYRPGSVVLLNDEVRERPVSGSFHIASLDLALVQLQKTFNLQARTLPAGIFLLT
ncbi:FecR family protein [Herbaspirillum sp. alder98]|uniref:FecR family protein n=1 Tax=Herbaspirillum sp. alder98 TaxID=2913096 RepID=UPI001CD82B59|nr:FecR domain-containing protein [Herbaspirillum sp. alder98]MCA1325574.1 FecR domain-containing protein [Herbaspirillum sp. alder98]